MDDCCIYHERNPGSGFPCPSWAKAAPKPEPAPASVGIEECGRKAAECLQLAMDARDAAYQRGLEAGRAERDRLREALSCLMTEAQYYQTTDTGERVESLVAAILDASKALTPEPPSPTVKEEK